jgi:hypothetical protein
MAKPQQMMKLAPPPPPRSAARESLAAVIGRVAEIERSLREIDRQMIQTDARSRQARAEAGAFVAAEERRARLGREMRLADGELRTLPPYEAQGLRELAQAAAEELARLPPLDRVSGEAACDESDRATAELLRLADRRKELVDRLGLAKTFGIKEAAAAVVLGSAEFAALRDRHAELVEELSATHAALALASGKPLPDVTIGRDGSSPLASEWRAAIAQLAVDPDTQLPTLDHGGD